MAKPLHLTDYHVLSNHMDCKMEIAAVLREIVKEMQEQ